jgi:hypothetical protein
MQQKSLVWGMRGAPLGEYAAHVTWERNPREGAGPPPVLLLDQG